MLRDFRKILLVTNICCCLLLHSIACLGSSLTVDQLITGVNLSRLNITSGEIRAVVEEFYPPRKSTEEIQRWMQLRREEILKRFPNPTPDQRRVMEKLLEIVPMEARRYGERKLRWEMKIVFQIFDNDNPSFPKLYRYRVNRSEITDVDLYSREGIICDAGKHERITYNGEGQLYELFSRFVPPYVSFEHGDRRKAFYFFHLFGRSTYQVPKGKTRLCGIEEVEGSKWYVLEFPTEKPNYRVRIWVDPMKQFCVHREERYHLSSGKLVLVKSAGRFKMFGDIWYPTLITMEWRKGNRIRRKTVITVKEALFNVSFPKDFFHVDMEKCVNEGMRTMWGSAISRDMLRGMVKQEPSEEIISTCGPRSLLIICERMGVKSSFEELAALSNFEPGKGTSMWGLYQAALKKGLNPKGIRVKDKDLLKTLPLPAIAYVGGNHFIVVEKVTENGVIISDPADKYANYLTMQEFYRIWNGEILIFKRLRKEKGGGVKSR